MPALGHTVVNDVPKALALKLGGASYNDISKIFGTSPQNIHRIISNRYPELDVEEFCQYHKAPDAFMELEAYRLVTKIDDDKRNKMLERRGVTDIAILTDKVRLLRGQSTSISEHVPTTVINILQARMESTASKLPTEKSQVIDITDDNK